jgi:hypothetical protein
MRGSTPLDLETGLLIPIRRNADVVCDILELGVILFASTHFGEAVRSSLIYSSSLQRNAAIVNKRSCFSQIQWKQPFRYIIASMLRYEHTGKELQAK